MKERTMTTGQFWIVFTVFTIAAMAFANPVWSVQEKPEPSIKITDSKLHSINYGIDSLQHWVDKLAAGDVQRSSRLMNDHQRLSQRLSRVPATSKEQYEYVRERLQSLKNQIKAKGKPASGSPQTDESPQTVAAAKPPGGLDSVDARLKNLEQDVVSYATAGQRFRSRVRSDLEGLQASFNRIEISSHPDYVSVKKRLESVAESLLPAAGALTMTSEETRKYVNGIAEKYGKECEVPDSRGMMINRELTVADVEQFITKAQAFNENARRDLPQLKQIVESTGQGTYWLKWLEKDGVEKLEKETQRVLKQADQIVEFGLRDVKQRSELDLEKNRYAFNNPSIQKNVEATFQRTLGTLQQIERMKHGLKIQPSESTTELQLNQYMATYREKVAAATQVDELPKEVGTPELHQIAEKTLGVKKYGVGDVVLQIVNSKPVPRDRIEHKEFNGSIETIVREWKEFQVTTVEHQNGKYFVYTNNLKKFSRAPRTTPIDVWIVSQRFKNGELIKKKLDAVK